MNSLLFNLFQSKKVLFFSGKGGVGKTTIAAATALSAANTNKKVLLVSTDPAHNLGHLFERPIGSQVVRLSSNLDGLELDPDQTVDEHIGEVSAVLRRLMSADMRGEINKHMELSREAPGMQEAAILEKIAQTIEEAEQQYDLIVFDTAPSGHTSRLMALPEMMSAWTEGLIKRQEQASRFKQVVASLGEDNPLGDSLFGGSEDDDKRSTESQIQRLLQRRKEKFSKLRNMLVDKNRCAFVLVLTAERLPVLETIEFEQKLQKTGIEVAGLVVNKRIPESSDPFLVERRKQELGHLGTLEKALPTIEKQQLPLTAKDVLGISALASFSEQLIDAKHS